MSELTYTTVDKSDWGEGPWQSEPDKVQWTDAVTGLPCLANRARSGMWCGYVGVAPGHPAFEVEYADLDDLHIRLDVHGPITYSDHCQAGDESVAICHVPEPGEPDNVWWFGFDCGHSFDIAPGRDAADRRRYEETGDPIWLPLASDHAHYRTLPYVRQQVAALAEQLAGLTKVPS